MAITTGYFVNNIDIGTLFGPKGASTAATTGYEVNSVDICQLLLALEDGVDIGIDTGYKVNNVDLRHILGAPSGSSPLPINGQFFAASAQSGTGGSSASIAFTTNASGWQVIRNVSPNSGSGVVTSGTIPSGATSVSFVLVINNQTVSTGSTNTAPTQTSLSSNQTVAVNASGSPSSPERVIDATATLKYYNASSAVISTTVISLEASATGAS